MLYGGVTALRVALTTPKCNFSFGGASGTAWVRPCGMQRRSRTWLPSGLFACLMAPGLAAGGGGRVFSHLDIWAPNMFPAEAEPLPFVAFHPPEWPAFLLDPLPCQGLGRGTTIRRAWDGAARSAPKLATA